MHLSDCSCAPILQFFDAALDGATANAKFRTAFLVNFYQFEEGYSVANASIWILFSPALRGFGVLYNIALNVS